MDNKEKLKLSLMKEIAQARAQAETEQDQRLAIRTLKQSLRKTTRRSAFFALAVAIAIIIHVHHNNELARRVTELERKQFRAMHATGSGNAKSPATATATHPRNRKL